MPRTFGLQKTNGIRMVYDIFGQLKSFEYSRPAILSISFPDDVSKLLHDLEAEHPFVGKIASSIESV